MAGEVTFLLTEDDYASANRQWLRRTVLARRKLPGHGVTLVICAAAGFLIASLDGTDPFQNALLFALVAAAGLVLFYGISYATVPSQARRLYRQQAAFRDPLNYFWSDAGFGYRAEHASANFAWRDYHRWSEGREGFMVFLNERMFYILPRHALTDEQAEDFRATALAFGPPQL